MRSKAMSSMYENLTYEKLEFVGYESLNVKQLNGSYAYADYGILRDERGRFFNQERLAEAVAITKTWGVYLVVLPNEGKIRIERDEREYDMPVLPDEMVVCFIQKGVFKTFSESSWFVRYALEHNFLYLQEDEWLFKLEDIVRRTEEAFVVFEKNAYDATQLRSNSKQLRRFLLDENNLMINLKQTCRYMGTSVNREFAENVYTAAFCIRIICKRG